MEGRLEKEMQNKNIQLELKFDNNKLLSSEGFGQFLVDCLKYSNPKKDRKVMYHSCS